MKIGIRLFVCILLALVLFLPAFSTAAQDLRFGKGETGDETLFADALFDLLFADETSLTDFERAYLRSKDTLSLTYSSADLPASLVTWNYDGAAGTLTIRASAFRYTAKNGEEVVWIPQSVCAQDEISHPLSQNGDSYTYVYSGLWNSGSTAFTVGYAWTAVLSAQTADQILTGAFPEGKALRERLDAFAIDHAEWERQTELYAAFCAELEQYQTAYNRWEAKKQSYDAYLAAQEAYDASIAEYQALSAAWEAYNTYRSQLSTYTAAMEQYSTYGQVMEKIDSCLAIMETMFTYTTDGNEWCFYPSLMGETVDSVLNGSQELIKAGAPKEAVLGARAATNVLRPLLLQYATARDGEYESEFEKKRALFEVYTTIYKRMRLQIGKLYDNILAIYAYPPTQRGMEMEYPEKIPHFQQFLSQLYILQALLDDFETVNLSLALPLNADKIVGNLVEPALRPADTDNADPVGTVFPDVWIEAPVAPAVVEKPAKELPVDPTLYGAPAPVEDPGPAPTGAPDPVADPGAEPVCPELTAAEEELLAQYDAGLLPQRTARGASQTLSFTKTVSQTATYQNKRTVIFYKTDGSELDRKTVEYGDPIADPPQLADYQTEQYTYTFLGWIHAGSGETAPLSLDSIQTDLSLSPLFAREKRMYSVTWNLWGSSSVVTLVTYGELPTYSGVLERPNDETHFYRFTGWSPAVVPVSGNAVYTAEWQAFPLFCEITWDLGNGNSVTDSVPYGTVPAYQGTPTKAATAQYSYTFTGWSPNIVAATADATYTAQWQANLRSYIVTWEVDGAQTSETLAYGANPQYSGTPTKPSTAQYSYTFAGWSPKVASVTGPATYTATWKETLRSYPVTWDLGNGTTSTEVLNYGATPQYNGTPTKPATAQYIYTFAGWSPAVTTVTGTVTYTALWQADLRSYTVTWDLGNGNTSTETVNYGTVPSYPGTPTRENDELYIYTFRAWTPTISAVDQNAVYTAIWDTELIQKPIVWHTVVWDLGDGAQMTVQVESGTLPAFSGTPTKAATAQYTYTFAGWSPNVVTATADVTYTALWQANLRSYIVIWDVNGTQTSETLAYGATPQYNGTPTKPSTAQYSYTFAGWSPEVTTVTGDQTYTALWQVNLRSYTVTWDVNGTQTSETLAYGANPQYSGTPAKPSTAQYSYTFVGWSPEVATVTGDQIYTAQWQADLRSYTVTWDVNGNQTSETLVYGATPQYSGTPEKASTAQYSYTFAGWSLEVTTVTDNQTYTALWQADLRSYTVTWDLGSGSVKTELVPYGELPEYSGTPEKPQDERFLYTFAGWSAQIEPVEGDMTYTALWQATARLYTVVWNFGDGTFISDSVPYGELPHYAGTPVREQDGQNIYTFISWSPEVVPVTGDATYTALWQSDQQLYTVTWDLKNGTVITASLAYGTLPQYAGTPEKASTAQYSYTFAGWSPEIVSVTSDATYTAIWIETPRSYAVTWDLGNGNTRTETLNYGVLPQYPGTPERAEDEQFIYTFAGWSPEVRAVTETATYTALWQAVPRYYTITWDLGTGETQTAKVQSGELPQFAGTPERADDEQYCYAFAGWSPKLLPAAANATYTALWQKSPLVRDADGNTHKTETTEQTVMVEIGEEELDLHAAADFAADDGKTVTLHREEATVTLDSGALREELPESGRVRWVQEEPEQGKGFRVEFVDAEGNALQTALTCRVALPYAANRILTVYKQAGETLEKIPAYDSVTTTGRLASFSVPAGTTIIYQIRYRLTYINESEAEYHTVLPTDAESGEVISLDAECDYGYEISGATLIHEDGSEPTEVGTSFIMPAESLTVKLHVTPIVYHVVFLCREEVLSDREYAFGETIVPPEDPVLPDEGEDRFVFRGWTRETVAGNEREVIYRANFSVISNRPEEKIDTGLWRLFVSPLFLGACGGLLAIAGGVVGIVIWRKKVSKKKKAEQSANQKTKES